MLYILHIYLYIYIYINHLDQVQCLYFKKTFWYNILPFYSNSTFHESQIGFQTIAFNR